MCMYNSEGCMCVCVIVRGACVIVCACVVNVCR